MVLGGAMPCGSSRARLDPLALPVRFTANDAGADERQRQVELDRERVVLRRAVRGIRMAIRLPISAFRGVVLRLLPAGTGPSDLISVSLEHRDPGLSVPLCVAPDSEDVVAEWRLWARVLGLPALVERAEGCSEPDQQLLGRVAVRPAAPRRRGKTILARRPRFLARRKLGRRELCVKVEMVEELFGGFDFDR